MAAQPNGNDTRTVDVGFPLRRACSPDLRGFRKMQVRMHYVTHLESAIDGTHLAADRVQTLHADRPLWVRYDLPAVGRAVTREALRDRPASLWRYRELLPVFDDANIVSLGETMTPLIEAPELGRRLGVPRLVIKDESHLPTGSFKSRGMALAISKAKELGLQRVAIPTAGNAGGAAAAYGARAGMDVFVFMPADTPMVNQMECVQAGAQLVLVDGLITDCGRMVREGIERAGWFDLSTLREPYRIEGKNTMGLELAEQCDWALPDVILYPTGGGTGLIGMWKAFDELRRLGWLRTDTMPRMVAAQSSGCAPIVRAFERGERFAEPWENAATIASGLRVPTAVGDFMILDAVRESQGCALAADESRIAEWMTLAMSCEGISLCPEAAVCVGALASLATQGWVSADDRVVLFNTAGAQKYPGTVPVAAPRIQAESEVNYEELTARTRNV